MSAGYALAFIAVLYTTAPAVAAFARTNLIDTVTDASYQQAEGGPGKVIPAWFENWENTALLAWVDKNQDGKVQYRSGPPFTGSPDFVAAENGAPARGEHGERLVKNALTDSCIVGGES